MNSFNELCKKISQDIVSKINFKRSWDDEERFRFDYSLSYFLRELWNKHFTHIDNETSIPKNKNYYSALAQYRDPNLTYRMAMKAFDGLQELGLIRITKKGYYDRNIMEGNLTRFKATHNLRELFNELEGHPAITLKPNLDIQTILLRDRIDGRNVLVPYDEDKDTEQWRTNLRKINECFSRHILDLKIKDTEIKELQERLLGDDEKEPIDLTKKVLVRIFNNNSFEQGGRFYRGWWQNVPSEYRKHITIDSKKTVEFDFSQLNPNIVYSAHNLELGNEDAYDRVLNGQHRDTLKEAFNAMLQASTELKHKPKGINLDALDMNWTELRQAILDSHKPIQHLFFKGLGNKLQFEDSCIAESVMLHYTHLDSPALPVHDSFVLHHAEGSYGKLEEVMRRAYYERFKSDIKVSKEIVVKQFSDVPTDKDGFLSMEVEDILNAEKDYSQWRDRDRMWLSKLMDK